MEMFQITSRGGSVSIDARLFRYIFDNGIMADHPKYLEALSSHKMRLSDLITLSRNAGVSYSLFFGSYDVVVHLFEEETARLFGSFDGKYSISTRGKVISLNIIRLFIKDIKQKQAKLANFVNIPKNKHVKYLKNSRRPLEDQAEYIVNSLGIDMGTYRNFSSKSHALMYIVEKIEDAGIFVSFENTGTNMPQTFGRADGLTGVYIKDNRFPYLFVANEGLSDFDKLPGRKVFTLIYLVACLFKGSSKMVSLSQGVDDDNGDEAFAISELILMPAELIPEKAEYSIEDLDDISKRLNVTSYALLVRIYHLGCIDNEKFRSLRDKLNVRYYRYAAAQKKKLKDKKDGFRHNIPRNIIAYQGKAFLRILRDQYSQNKISRREVNRQLAYGKKYVDLDKVFSKL